MFLFDIFKKDMAWDGSPVHRPGSFREDSLLGPDLHLVMIPHDLHKAQATVKWMQSSLPARATRFLGQDQHLSLGY